MLQMCYRRLGGILPIIKMQSSRQIYLTPLRLSSNIDGQFEASKMKLNTLKSDPGNETKLKIYALFKQATVGKNDTPKPGTFNFIGQAKWSAWSGLDDMSMDDAKKAYIDVVKELAMAEGNSVDLSDDENENQETDAKIYGSNHIIVKTENQITTITLNRPQKFNAVTSDMYKQIITILNDLSKDDSTSVVVLTGEGEYYSSGNDLNNFLTIPPSEMEKAAVEGADFLASYIASYIDFPKPIVAAVNGPAIGVAVSVLGLLDAVYASDKATFQTPFSKIGQSPEACSSYIFPKLMGHSKACEMLLFNRKISAEEAERRSLVTRVFPHNTFRESVQKEVEEMVKLPLKSLIYSKKLMRDVERDILCKVNREECDRLIERWTSEDCMNAVMAVMSKK